MCYDSEYFMHRVKIFSLLNILIEIILDEIIHCAFVVHRVDLFYGTLWCTIQLLILIKKWDPINKSFIKSQITHNIRTPFIYGFCSKTKLFSSSFKRKHLL